MIKKTRKFFLNYIPILMKTAILHKMPFMYPLFEIKPASAVIMITNRCNLRCAMCKQWKETPKKELSTEDWQSAIKDLKRNGVKNIHFTGGEPLLRKDIIELVRHGTQNGFSVGMTTNGLLLTESLCRDFMDAGLRSVAVSLDGLGEGYEKLRGVPGSFARVKKALSVVSEAKRKKKIDAYINFTLMKNTIENFKEVKNLADKLKLPVAICLLDKASSIFDVKENQSEFWFKDENDFKKLEKFLDFLREEKIKDPSSIILNFSGIDFIAAYFKDPVQKDIPCVSSQDKIFLDAYGNIWGGCLSMGTFGNIKNVSLGALMKEKKYRKAKKNMFYKKCGGCSCGYLFNIQHFPALMAKDFGQRIKYFCNRNV